MKKEQFNVTGMTCAACSARVEKAVGKLPGVDKIAVNLLKNSMVVEYDETALDTQKIIGAVTEAGYGASLKEAAQQGKASKSMQASANDIARQEYEAVKKRLKLSLVFAVPLSYISMGHMMGWPLPEIFLGVENAMIFSLTLLLLVIPVVFINLSFSASVLKLFLRLRRIWIPLLPLVHRLRLFTACTRFIKLLTALGTAIWHWYTGSRWTCILNPPV